MKKNQILTLSVTDLNNLGYGVAHLNGFTVFVAGAIDGEEVEARVILVKPTYAVCRLERVLKASPHRITLTCPHSGCGGCAYGHITYAHECELKAGYVRSAFRRAGLDPTVMPVSVAIHEGAPKELHYRNKAQYPVSSDGHGGYTLGFFAPKSHRVVEAADCPLQDRRFQPILNTLRGWLSTHGVPAYDETTGQGLIRHVYLRASHAFPQVLLTLVLTQDALPAKEELVATLRAAHPEIVGILVNINAEDTNVICGKTWRTLWGRNHLADRLGGVTLKIPAPAFYQVNHDAAEALYAKAKELADLHGSEELVDLYCGCGSIGLSMADKARRVVGIEIEPSAVAYAKENATLNGIQNAHFWCGDAGKPEALLSSAIEELSLDPQVVVLDPPRKGCTPALLSYLAERKIPKIVYVSCNPETLARDAAQLISLGYEMGAVYPFDLFPRTGHVESVVRLSRK